MREIKFRAWCVKSGYFVNTSQVFINLDGCVCAESEDDGTVCAFSNQSALILEQFIGLHDKNGKEIYENDICKIRFDIDKVEDYIYASLTEKEIRTCELVFVVESPLFNNQPELNADIIEIIGNIHETPALLND